MPTKSLNEEAFLTLEHEVEDKERKRSDNRPGKHEGVWISQKVYKQTPSWKEDERFGKHCRSMHTSKQKDATPCHSHQPVRCQTNHQTVLHNLGRGDTNW